MRSNGVSTVRGCFNIEVNVRTIVTLNSYIEAVRCGNARGKISTMNDFGHYNSGVSCAL